METGLLLLRFIVLGISLTAPVGPLTIEMLKRGIAGGFWHAWICGFGGMSADFFFLLIIYFGAGSMLDYIIIKVCMFLIGTVFLIMLGVNSIKSAFQDTYYLKKLEKGSLKKAYVTGIFIGGFNPFSIVFWFGVYGSTLSQLVEHVSKPVSFIYSLSIFIGIFLWSINIALTAHFGRHLLNDKTLRVITGAAGIVLIAFGISFAVDLCMLVVEWGN